MMTEDEKIRTYAEVTVEHVKDGICMGLDPKHVVNITLLAAIRLMQDVGGNACAIEGMERALAQLRSEAARG